MDTTRLVTAKEYIEKKGIAKSTFYDRLLKGKIFFFQIKSKRKKYFSLDDGIVWKKKKGKHK